MGLRYMRWPYVTVLCEHVTSVRVNVIVLYQSILCYIMLCDHIT
jgi:hypothetical protein